MKLGGFAVQYLLSREFDNVTAEGISRGATFDYPMLYDVSADMSGHVVLVPDHERPADDMDMTDTLCICVGEQSMRSALEAGAAALLAQIDFPFQHLYNRVMRMFLEQERLDARLRTLVDTYAGFQPLLEACAHTIGHPCALVDAQYRLVCRSSTEAIAQTGGQDAGENAEALEPDAIDLFMASPEYRYMRSSKTVFTLPSSGNLMMKNVFSKGELVGSLVIEHEGDAFGAIYVRFFLDYLSSFVEEAYGRIGSFGLDAAAADHVKAALPNALAGKEAGLANLEEALAASGHARGTSYVVLRIERSFTNEGAEESDYLARRFEMALPQGYCFSERDNLFMLADIGQEGQRDGRNTLRELSLIARDNLSKVGISTPFTSLSDFAAARTQATIALDRGSQVDPTAWSYRFSDYAFSWLAARATRNVNPKHTCHPALVTLTRYDDSHGTDLRGTLRTFMECRYNASLAANELFIARSTLLNRLERIAELTQIDLEDFGERAYLAFSFEALG